MNTYGMHSIHGRAPAIATGLATARQDLSVWVVTGDGDALSIGGNHLIHALRRNVNLKILLFNNRIYGLTKGQYSPTSEQGKITKSTPLGSLDAPFNPLSLALGAEASFVARTIDSDRKHLTGVLRAAAAHEGTALVEIYQNCNIFNDDAFELLKNPDTRDESVIRLEHGEPVRFGVDGKHGVVQTGQRQPDRRRRRRGRPARSSSTTRTPRTRPPLSRSRGLRTSRPSTTPPSGSSATSSVPPTTGRSTTSWRTTRAKQGRRRPGHAARRPGHLGHRLSPSARGTRLTEQRQASSTVPGAYLLWGLFPLYFPLLVPADRSRSSATGCCGAWSS